MNKLGIQAKIWLSFSAVAVGYVALLVFGQWVGYHIESHAKVASETFFPAALKSQQADAAFQRILKRYNDAVILQDKHALDEAGTDVQAAVGAINSIKQLPNLPSRRVDQITALLGSLEDATARSRKVYAAMIDAGSNVTEQIQKDVVALAPENKRVEASLRDLQSNIASDFKAELAVVDLWSERQRTFGIVLFAVMLGISCAVLTATIRRSIVGPVMAAVVTLDQAVNRISGATSQLASSSDSLAHGASAQAASLEETSASTEEVSSVTRKSAENSQSVVDLMATVNQQIKQGNVTLDRMVQSMTEINASSDKIAKIIKVIDEIAFQTNILALNAAVEAARAGDAGLGFAVVADEVRNLAQRSAQAAKDTAALIEESISTSNEGRVRLKQVSEVIGAITGSAGQVKELVDEVNQQSQEQTRAITQIANAVVQLDHVTQTTAANAQETATAGQELRGQVSALNEVVHRLRGLVDGQSRAAGARLEMAGH